MACRDGQTQMDRVTVTDRTKVIGGVTATVVRDVARHGGTLLEQTTDWFAQDVQGNVCYLGEDTKAYGPNGQVDTSGSWEAGVDGAVAGIIMEADPQVPGRLPAGVLPAARPRTLPGSSDAAARLRVPYGVVHDVLTSLEHTALEPDVVDQKVYAPGLGIVLERRSPAGRRSRSS